jgi:hypothetical protein
MEQGPPGPNIVNSGCCNGFLSLICEIRAIHTVIVCVDGGWNKQLVFSPKTAWHIFVFVEVALGRFRSFLTTSFLRL